MSLKSQNQINPNFSMSSMTDVVFLLLIFFMLTSTLVTTNALKITLPTSSAEPIKQQTISISITEDLRYFINNDPIDAVNAADDALIELGDDFGFSEQRFEFGDGRIYSPTKGVDV